MSPRADTIVEDREAAEARAEIADDLTKHEEIQKVVKTVPMEKLAQYRAFVNPTSPNTRYLIRPGEVISLRDQNSPTGFRDVSRETPGHPEKSDKWAIFLGGVLVTDDPEVIAWCENPAQAGICRDANLQGSEFWFKAKQAQISLSTRDPSFEPGIDVDAALRGEGLSATSGIVASAQDSARTANVQA